MSFVARQIEKIELRLLLCTVYLLQFSLPYNGNKVTGVLGSSVNFTWAFSGGQIDLVQWGTKKAGTLTIQNELVSINELAKVTTIQTLPYKGRVNGSWDGSSPGQATFTLYSIQKADERIYICRLEPDSLAESEVFDTVQLLVVGE